MSRPATGVIQLAGRLALGWFLGPTTAPDWPGQFDWPGRPAKACVLTKVKPLDAV